MSFPVPRGAQHTYLLPYGTRRGMNQGRRAGLFISLICLLALLTQSGCLNVTSSAGEHGTSRPPSANSAPSILTQPASQTINAGQTATFFVTASGTAPLSYQWQKNGVAISGAISASYTTPAETAGAQFVVVVSNSAGSATSNVATLTVNTVPGAITLNPSSLTLAVGNTQAFSANISGTSNTAVTWTASGAGCISTTCGTISANGIYVAPMSVPSPPSVTVRATSAVDSTKSASASVTIVTAAAVVLSLSPANASVVSAGTQFFNAGVTGTSNTNVNWKVTGAGCSGAGCGSLSTSGLRAVYSAPSVAPSPASVTVTAVSAADSTKSASAAVTVVPVVAVTVSPSGLSVPTATTQQYNAAVTGNSNTAVSWSVSGAGCTGVACGTLSSGGLYTAPAAIPSQAVVAITATSSIDPSKSGVAYLTIVAPGKIGPTLPTLPQATVDLTMPIQGTSACPTLTTGSNCIRNVPAGDAVNFQKAINAATCGDTIVLVAGSTYSGNFTIPQTTCTNNSGWIFIVSSALASLPTPNHRVGPSNVSNMAQVSTPNTNPAFWFLANSNHWRLVGLEITTSFVSTSSSVYNLVLTGTDLGAQLLTSTTLMPSYLIFDRIYIHGLSNTQVTRAYYLDLGNVAVVDGYCSEIHNNVYDSQCLSSVQGPGPFLIQNNYLEASCENIMFGGSNPVISGILPSDITIVGNLMNKPLSWRGQAAPLNWVVKNLFELKIGQRILVDGNVLQNTWANQQDEAVLIRAIGYPLGAVQDVTFTNNLIQHAPNAIFLSGQPTVGATATTKRVLVQNNLMLDIGITRWGGVCVNGYLYNISSGGQPPYFMSDVVIDHNTGFSENGDLWLDGGGVGGTTANFQFTNNIGDFGNQDGIQADGQGIGINGLTTFTPSYNYGASVFINSAGTPFAGYSWPTGQLWSTFSNVAFTSVSGTDPNLTGNFQLLNSSPYHNAGTDGKDVGVWDWAVFNTKTTNALSGIYQ
jgi:hypothetical protein